MGPSIGVPSSARRSSGGGRGPCLGLLGAGDQLLDLGNVQLLAVLLRKDPAKELDDAGDDVGIAGRGLCVLAAGRDRGVVGVELEGIERRNGARFLGGHGGEAGDETDIRLGIDVFAAAALLAQGLVDDVTRRHGAGQDLQPVRARHGPLEPLLLAQHGLERGSGCGLGDPLQSRHDSLGGFLMVG